jgi:hypothetical protein
MEKPYEDDNKTSDARGYPKGKKKYGDSGINQQGIHKTREVYV